MLVALIAVSLVGGSILEDYVQKNLDATDKEKSGMSLEQRKAFAEQGDTTAQYDLAVMYDNGQGVAQDFKAAANWYARAAEMGHASAQFSLSGMYERGRGVPQDYKTATMWLTRAAEKGHPVAQNYLGMAYMTGQGTPRNYVRAHKWWNIAASQGDEKAKEYREKIEKTMSSTQIVEAKRRAREWVEKHKK